MAFRETPDGVDRLDVLIRLLKLGSFINMPMKEGVCDPADVGTTEFRVLMALAGEGALAGHDLVGIMGLPPMNVSRAIAALRKRGWIEDAHDPDNRRRKPVRLSADGRSAYALLENEVSALAHTLIEGLSARQRRQFARLADRLIDNMADWIISRHADMRVKWQG